MMGIAMALGASASWAMASFVTLHPLQVMSVLRFSMLRFGLVASVFAILTFLLGGFVLPRTTAFWTLVLSGVIGIGLGETLLYAAIRENGPQVGLFLFSLNIPITFTVACLLGAQDLTLKSVFGVLLVISGVLLGVKARGYEAQAKAPRLLSWGVLAGLGAAIGQSAGLFLTKSVFVFDVSVIEVTAVRATSAAFVIACVMALTDRGRGGSFPKGKALRDVVLSTVLSSGMGLYLANMSLKFGSPTIAAACLSLSPMFVAIINSILRRTLPQASLIGGCIFFVCGLFLIS